MKEKNLTKFHGDSISTSKVLTESSILRKFPPNFRLLGNWDVKSTLNCRSNVTKINLGSFFFFKVKSYCYWTNIQYLPFTNKIIFT